MIRLSALLGMSLAGVLGAIGPVIAQEWPAKAVRIIVTFPPGGSSDVVARLIAVPLAERLAQSVVVDNKPGAGGTIGAAEVARAAPDGYTWLLSNSAPISISPFMLAKAPYDPVKSFNHAFYIGSVANVFVVHPSVPVKTIKELIAWVNAQSKPVNYGSGGIGSIGHIVGETFKKDHKLNMEHIGYKGSAPMHTALLGAELQLAIDTLPQNVPYMRDGKLRALAVTSAQRAAMAPEVPTVAELAMPKLTAENFLGMSAPAKTAAAITSKMRAALAEAMKNASVRSRLDELGVIPRAMSEQEFNSFVAKQASEWEPAVRASGARLN